MPSVLSKSNYPQPYLHKDGTVFWIPLTVVSAIKAVYGNDIFIFCKDLLGYPINIAKIIKTTSVNGVEITDVHSEIIPVILNKYNRNYDNIRFLSDGLLNYMNYTVSYNDRKRLAEWICPILNKRIVIYDDSLPLIPKKMEIKEN